MNTGSWDEESESPWHIYGSAEDEGRVYQAGRDQHITEYHIYGSAPDTDDDDVDDNWYYADAGGGFGGGVWETLLSVLFALAPLLPLAVAGASIHSVWGVAESPRSFWSVLYSLGAVVVGVAGFVIIRERLSYRSDLVGALSWLYWPMNIGVFVYYLMGDPAGLDIAVIGDLGLVLARKLGPL